MTDLLDLIAEAEREVPAPCLFGSATRGIPARIAELEAWKAAYGAFDSSRGSRAWDHATCHPRSPTRACRPSALSADLRCGDWRHREGFYGACSCAGGLLYRGACTGCDWEGLIRDGEMPAVEDAHDHAWPGWRELPVITARKPKDAKAAARWWQEVAAACPAGWIASGGPVRIARDGRHNGSHGTPHGGYDMAVHETGSAR